MVISTPRQRQSLLLNQLARQRELVIAGASAVFHNSCRLRAQLMSASAAGVGLRAARRHLPQGNPKSGATQAGILSGIRPPYTDGQPERTRAGVSTHSLPSGESLLTTTRRDLLTAAVTAATGAAASATLAEAPGARDAHDHDHQDVPSDPALRVKALESLLVAKGLVDPAALDALVDTYEHKIGPRNGARVVARAWTDPAYRQRLLTEPVKAIAELGYSGLEGDEMVVVENTPMVHNLVVCTLCSCYPWPVLGLPPVWYKSSAYRARAVIDPRGVMKEFGLTVADEVEVRVWDSTAELRYFVLPERPAGTAHLSEAQLAALVTRDAMIGVRQVPASLPRSPA